MDNMHVRNQFPFFSHQQDQKKPIVFLDSGASSQKPKVVMDAMSDFMEKDYANVHRGIHCLSAKATIAFENARKKVAKFIHAPLTEEVIFVRGLTEGMNLIAHSFGSIQVKRGQTILLSQMEHHSNMIPWMMLAERVGAKVDYIPVTDQGDLDLDVYKEKITQNIGLVSVVHVSNVLGTVNPIKEISSIAKANNVPVVIDGAQAAHHMPINVDEVGCDFYVLTGHKMYGPTGIGAIWGKKEHLDSMPPYHGGGEMVDQVNLDGFTTKEGPAKFEAGTPNIVGAVGLGAAIDFIDEIGFDWIQAYEQSLSKVCHEALTKIENIRLLGSPKHKIGVYAFELKGFHPHDMATLLDQEGVAVRVGSHCAQPLHKVMGCEGSIRVSLGMYNNKQDIEALTHAITKAMDLLG